MITLSGHILLSAGAWLAAMQISTMDIRRLSVRLSSPWRPANTLAVIGMALFVAALLFDCHSLGLVAAIGAMAAALLLSAVWVWVMSRLNPSGFPLTVALIFLPVVAGAIGLSLKGSPCLTPFMVYGFYYRNCPFGNLFGKRLLLVGGMKPTPAPADPEPDVAVGGETLGAMQDFSRAGCLHDINPARTYNVVDHGIRPDTGADLTAAVQSLIDRAGESGGGRIFFPRGRYVFNKDKSHPAFLQINHSNIVIEGETDQEGRPLAELMCQGSLVRGERNPWLSPFFITTGEQLQQSNIFWGIQFRNKKDIRTQSGSLADPGSDGTILQPPYASDITRPARRGDTLLHVSDALSLKGAKYVVLALFNNGDDSLIREILNCKELRAEWLTARRAADEGAPSFQALMEIESVCPEAGTIRLARPLRRDIGMQLSPKLYVADMLEQVAIRNLIVSSSWNGLFRHHGFPIYYSVGQTQQMDYGWNGINMKRVAHGRVENIVFRNLSNPLYIMDSLNVSAQHLLFTGHDGHQGIKIYEHTADCLLRDIEFRCHYADMMGGEGNAYGNVFSRIRYTNPLLKPVDFDFHGFSEGPFSPPSYNLFELIRGFRHIKGAGALYNQPASARDNLWWNIQTEGEERGDNLFVNLCYVPRGKARLRLTAAYKALVAAMQQRSLNPRLMARAFKERLSGERLKSIPLESHHELFPLHTVVGIKTGSRLRPSEGSTAAVKHQGHIVAPLSLYDFQRGGGK